MILARPLGVGCCTGLSDGRASQPSVRTGTGHDDRGGGHGRAWMSCRYAIGSASPASAFA